MLRKARVARNDLEDRLVDLPTFVNLDGRHHQPFRPHVGRIGRQAAGDRAAYVVVVPKNLAEPDQPVAVEDGDGRAEIGNVADPAGAVVGIVPEKDVAGVDVALVEVLEDRLDQGRIRPPGQLAPLRIEERDAVVVLVPDHRRARGSLDRRLDLELGGADRTGNDLELDRAERRSCVLGRDCAHASFSRMRLP